jgi:protein TonB
MYKIISVFVLMFMSASLVAQEVPKESPPDEYNPMQRVKEDQNKIYDRVELDPSFYVEGQNLAAWLSKKIADVKSSQKKLPKEKVVVKAVIERDGSLGSYEFQNRVNRKLKKATQDILATMPKWNPAHQNGDKVRCYTIFELNW